MNKEHQKHGKKKDPPKPRAPLTGAFTQLLPEIQKSLQHAGYTTPTPIQEQAIPHLLEEQDMMGCAQTGTGKTAAFTLPILQALAKGDYHSDPGHPQALILAPTRELAAQIDESIATYGHNLDITHTVIFGGVNEKPQIRALRSGVDIVVATPGRLLDLIQHKHLSLEDVEIFVLDEADRMLDMGFIHDIRKVLKMLPKERWSLFFSATMPPEVKKLANGMLTKPVHIAIAPEKPAVERIKQSILFVDRDKKDKLLAELMKDPEIHRAIVFTQMKHVANRVCQKLERVGIAAAAIHGNKTQAARVKALDRFKAGKVRVLVATDIAARGIDVDGITHVINYDLPNEPETYVHRIGRTARAGMDGTALSFCAARERDYLRSIEKLLKKTIPVDIEHNWHSEESKNATGADARPEPKVQRGGNRGKGGGQRTRRNENGKAPNRRRSPKHRSSRGR